MSATVTPKLSNPDPNWNPTDLSSLWGFLNDSLETVPVDGGPFTPPVISSTTPAVSDQDKIWSKTDGNGRPLGFFLFYNGNWRKVYTGNTSELRMFEGNPATYFDNTGLGLVGGDWDGWAIMNGNNGTINRSDSFPVFGRMDNTPISGYNSGWQANVTGGATKTGGASAYSIKNTDLPPMKVSVNGFKYSAGAGNSPKRVLVDGDYNPANNNFDPAIQASFGSDPNGTPPVPQTLIPTLPPYFVCCLVKFVGYS